MKRKIRIRAYIPKGVKPDADGKVFDKVFTVEGETETQCAMQVLGIQEEIEKQMFHTVRSEP